MKLLIVIVNYRSAELVSDALESLIPELEQLRSCHVVVVDNASGDDSMRIFAELLSREPRLMSFTSLVQAAENGGFSYGNNVGVRHWLVEHDAPDYVLLLNPDTLVRGGALSELLSFMDAHGQVGIAGSRLEDPDGTPQCSAFRFPSVPGEFVGAVRFGPVSRLLRRWVIAMPVSDTPHRADWVAGASMIVRMSVIEQIGLLDEAYFLYFEEVDFCVRARRASWDCWYVPSSRVVHLVGQVSQVTDPSQRRKRRPKYWFESRRRYFLKNHGPAVLVAADLAAIVGQLLYRVRLLLEQRDDDLPSRFLADFLRNSVLFRRVSP